MNFHKFVKFLHLFLQKRIDLIYLEIFRKFPPINSKIFNVIFFSQAQNIFFTSKIFLNSFTVLKNIRGWLLWNKKNDADYSTNLKCFDLLLHFLKSNHTPCDNIKTCKVFRANAVSNSKLYTQFNKVITPKERSSTDVWKTCVLLNFSSYNKLFQ